MSEIRQMKWGAWGAPGEEFNHAKHPGLEPFVRKSLKLDSLPVLGRGLSAEEAKLSEPRINTVFAEEIERALGAGRLLTDREQRLLHAYGKSFRDLWRARLGIVDFAPDAVIYPESEDDVVLILAAANRHGVAIVPFGGGTNIAGCVELRGVDTNMAVTVDMRRMDRVISVDAQSATARIQAGATGPRLEEQLAQQGHTLGHFPDSFIYSTLGGWLATRGAGMQSDGYGNVEDMVVALRMVTPTGTIVSRAVPHTSAGIDVTGLAVGSEGTLGIITEATMRVRRTPERQAIYGYIFPDLASGIKAVHECQIEGCTPTISRLSDVPRTQMSFAFAGPKTPMQSMVQNAFKYYVGKVRRIDFSTCCLHLAGFEGSARQFADQKRKVEAIYKRHGAVGLGSSPGKTFSAGKYEYPMLRDWAMDRGLIVDVSETSVRWSGVDALYQGTRKSIEDAIRGMGVEAFVACHFSHAYRDGISLYYTFAFADPHIGFDAYLRAKKAAEDGFLRHGGTLSHHHAVGYEHLPWLGEDVSVHGVRAMRALRSGLDPAGIMNPGKLTDDFGFDAWGLGQEEMPRAAAAE